MIVQTFFEQLGLQLGVVRIKEYRVKRSGQTRIHRAILQKPDLPPDKNVLWYLFDDVVAETRYVFRLHDNWQLQPKHIDFMRASAWRVNWYWQRQLILKKNFERHRAAEIAWDSWQDVFEDFIKQLGFDPASAESASTK